VYEIRKYPKLLVAKTFVPRTTPNFSYSIGFQTLANFIFGGNKAGPYTPCQNIFKDSNIDF
jgi:hypothetical protein